VACAAWRGLEAALVKCPDHAVALGNVGYLHAISGQLAKVHQSMSLNYDPASEPLRSRVSSLLLYYSLA